MPRSWIYFLLILFVAYLISLDPTEAGQTANTFFGWLGDLGGSALQFIDSLVEGADPQPVPNQPAAVVTQ